MVDLALIFIPLYNEMFRGCFTVGERKIYKYASEIIQIGAVLLDEGFNRKRGIKDDKNYI